MSNTHEGDLLIQRKIQTADANARTTGAEWCVVHNPGLDPFTCPAVALIGRDNVIYRTSAR